MQENVPVLSKFLAEYLDIWDGNDYFECISQLLPFLNFKCYEELEDCVLRKLQMIFMSSNLKSKCVLLATLGDLVVNIVSIFITLTR